MTRPGMRALEKKTERWQQLSGRQQTAAARAVVMERMRRERSIRWLDDLKQDVRYAGRMMLRAPAFAAVAVISLTLGIGANTAIFSVVRALVFKPLPYVDSEQLVRLTADVPASESPDGRPMRSGTVSGSELAEIRSRVRGLSDASFSGSFAFKTMTNRGEARRLQGLRVSPGLFETLGVSARIGRTFDSSGNDGSAAIVFSHAAWERYFGGELALVGQTVALFDSLSPNNQINLEGYTVIGVMPEGFAFPDAQSEFWIPATPAPNSTGALLARLADSTSLEAAAAEIRGVLRSLRPNQPSATFRLARMRDTIAEPLKPALLAPSAARRAGAADCVRQRGQSPDCAGFCAAPGNRRACRARRWPRTHDPSAAGGEPRARAPRRPRRGWRGGRRDAPASNARLNLRPHRPWRAARHFRGSMKSASTRPSWASPQRRR